MINFHRNYFNPGFQWCQSTTDQLTGMLLNPRKVIGDKDSVRFHKTSSQKHNGCSAIWPCVLYTAIMTFCIFQTLVLTL